jgi:hypothetical protein
MNETGSPGAVGRHQGRPATTTEDFADCGHSSQVESFPFDPRPFVPPTA